MNDVIKEIHKGVLEQIESQHGCRYIHPDSTTGITASVAVEGSHTSNPLSIVAPWLSLSDNDMIHIDFMIPSTELSESESDRE